MKTAGTNRRWMRAKTWIGLASLWLLALGADGRGVVHAAAPNKPGAEANTPRPLRVAIFEVEVLKDVDVEGGAITDHLNMTVSSLPGVTVVDRQQIQKVAEEHQIALSGMVDNASASRLGKFLSAEYVMVGRASKIGQTFYLVLKVVDVETTEQTTVSAKADAQSGFETVLERLSLPLTTSIRKLQSPKAESDDSALAELRKLAEPLRGKVVLLRVEEDHIARPVIERPLRDPAAQTAILARLRSLGLTVIAPAEPVIGWKESLLQTGKYGDQRVDFLLEGEGMSAFAAQLHGLTSCRARVELSLIPVPGRTIATSECGVAAAADLAEALAAKAALEGAGIQACDALIRRKAEEDKRK
ncbi:MAG: hypothetical protein GXY83_24015 [Rhodopirellula sp.]|nr:hypothetical protein [Rhodopirellula sp.]